MAKKLFWKNYMASEDVGSKLVHGRFYNDADETAEIFDGALVTIGDLEDHAFYPGVKDLNVRKIKFATADTDEVAIVDIVERPNGDIMGVNYREGIKTAGMTALAGIPVRVRILDKLDSFNIGSGNIKGEAVVGEYLIPEANTGLWIPSAEKVEGKTTVKVEGTSPLTEGVVDTDVKYLCTIVALA